MFALSRSLIGVILIDLDMPGDQGEGLNVIKFWGHTVGHFEHSGVDVMLVIDAQDYEVDLYDFSFIEGSNKAVLSKPLMEAHYFDKAEMEVLVAEPFIRKGHDAARAAYSKMTRVNAETKMKKYDVVFPAGYQLSQRVFNHPTGVEGEYISAVPTMISYRKNTGHVNGAGNVIYSIRTRLSWKFTNLAAMTEIDTGVARGRATVAAAYAGM